ncbi:radical SAM protein [Elusimicrobiota bacterium]
MKVALMQTPAWGTREPPLGIVQLAGMLKSRGFAARSFDLNNYLYKSRSEGFCNQWAWEQSMFWYKEDEVTKYFSNYKSIVDKFLEEVYGYDPDVIGFSVSASTFWSSCELAKILKNTKKDMVIVFGGEGFYNKEFIEKAFLCAPVDFVVRGEGELTFAELLECIDRKKEISICSGIYIYENGKVKFTGERAVLEDLNKIPFSDYSDLRFDDYDDTVHMAIMASRGCIWNCSFCSSRAFWSDSSVYRWMSAERIHQEMYYNRINRRAIGHVDFMDLAFNGNMERTIELCELLVKYPIISSLPKIRWVANAVIRPELTKDVLELMAAAGCKKLIFGIESGSEKVLKLMRKPQKISVAKRVIKDTSDAGIEVTTNFMFGFPGETDEDFMATLDFITDVGQYIERVYPSRTYCALEEYSYFHEYPEKFNIKKPFNHHLYWETNDGKNSYPVRLKRCAEFEKLCGELNILVDCGVKTSIEMDNWYNLGHYYEYKKDFSKAAEYLIKYLKEDPKNDVIRQKLLEITKKADVDLPDDLNKQADEILKLKGLGERQ